MLQPIIRILSSKGQIVIPAEFRQFLGLKPKMKMLIWPRPKEKKVILEPLSRNSIEAGFGLLADWGKSATKIMKEARKEERRYEARKTKKLGLG